MSKKKVASGERELGLSQTSTDSTVKKLLFMCPKGHLETIPADCYPVCGMCNYRRMMKPYLTCGACEGRGRKYEGPSRPCTACGGKGIVAPVLSIILNRARNVLRMVSLFLTTMVRNVVFANVGHKYMHWGQT